jgi:hypothetical protein
LMQHVARLTGEVVREHGGVVQNFGRRRHGGFRCASCLRGCVGQGLSGRLRHY